MCFYSNSERERSFDVEFNFASNAYPHYILLTYPATQKTRNTWKNVMMMSSSHFFSGISYFGGSGVHQKYAMWVIIGFRIKFHIQQALPIKIWVRTQGDMSKIRTKKVDFFYDKYVNLIIMVDSFYWNSIGSWIPTTKLFLARFLIRPVLDPKFPLMKNLKEVKNPSSWDLI